MSASAGQRVASYAGFAFCMVVFAWCIGRAVLVPNHFSMWAYGDAQMFDAGVHFANEGHLAHYFLPEINPGDPHSFIANNGVNGRYAHYPALHALVNGAIIFLVERLGIRDVVIVKQLLQVFYLLVVAGGVICYFKTLRPLYGVVVGVLFCAFLVLSPWVAGFGDSVCDQPLNIALLGAFLLTVTSLCRGPLPVWSSSTAVIAFAASRNTIEIVPVCVVFALLYGGLTAYAMGRPLRRVVRFWVVSVLAPMLFGVLLQLYQAFLDAGDSRGYGSYLSGVAGHFGHNSFLDYVMTLPNISIALMLFIVLFSVQLWGRIRGSREAGSASDARLTFAVAFAVAMLAFPFFLPDQAWRMRAYSQCYLYVPAFLCAIVALQQVAESRNAILGPRRVFAMIQAGAAFATIGLLLTIVTAEAVVILRDPLDTSNYYSLGAVRATVAAATKPTDILLFPVDYRTSYFEISPLIEFYLQRHGVPSGTKKDLVTICAVVNRDRLRLTGTYPYYVVPRLFFISGPSAPGAANKPALTPYTCPAA